MRLSKTFKELCTPAMVYLTISIIAIFIALFNGLTLMVVAAKAIFVLFWTLILNLLCKNGMKYVSWFLVLLPYIFIFVGVLITLGGKKEGFQEGLTPQQQADENRRKAEEENRRKAEEEKRKVEQQRVDAIARAQAEQARARAQQQQPKLQAINFVQQALNIAGIQQQQSQQVQQTLQQALRALQ
jgi:hypothetical protein